MALAIPLIGIQRIKGSLQFSCALTFKRSMSDKSLVYSLENNRKRYKKLPLISVNFLKNMDPNNTDN